MLVEDEEKVSRFVVRGLTAESFAVDAAADGLAGLGLSIVKSICAAHQGRVSVESSEGKGSRLRVELPLANGQRGGSP